MATTVRLDRVAQKFLNLYHEDFLTQANPLWRKVVESGKMEKGTGSHTYRWPVRAKRSDSRVITVGEALDFQATDIYRMLELEYKNFITTELLYEIEREQAHGNFVVPIAEGFVEQLRDTLMADLSRQAYADGDTATNLDGLRTWTSASEALGGATALLTNNDTYAGQSTAPDGIESDSAKDGHRLLSPNLIDGTSTEFTGSTWRVNAREALRKAILEIVERKGDKANLCVFMNTADYGAFLDNAEDDARLVYSVGKGQDAERRLGFNMVYFDGVPIYQDAYCPAGHAFVIDFSKKGGFGTISPRGGELIKVKQADEIDILAEKYVVRAHFNFITRVPSLHACIFTA